MVSWHADAAASLTPQAPRRRRGGEKGLWNSYPPVGLIGWPGDTAYGAAKAGLIGFTRSLAKEVAPYGITANVVVPGDIRTDMTAALTAKNIEQMLSLIPLTRAGEPEDVAEVVTFLATRARYVTGAVYAVDRGLSL